MIAFINHPAPDRLDTPLTKGGHAPRKRSCPPTLPPPTLPLSSGSLREKRRCTSPFAAIAGGTQTPLRFGMGGGRAIRHLQVQSRSRRAPIRLIGYRRANMPLRIWLNFRLDTWPWPGTRPWWLPESPMSGWRFATRSWLPSARSKKSVPTSSVSLVQPPALDHGEPRSRARQFRLRGGQRARWRGRRHRREGPRLIVSRFCRVDQFSVRPKMVRHAQRHRGRHPGAARRPARSLPDSHRPET